MNKILKLINKSVSYIAILTIIHSALSYPSLAMEGKEKEKEGGGVKKIFSSKKLDEIELAIKEVDKRLKIQQPGEKVTVILGMTASGKTTIYNYLRGVPLIAKFYDGEFVIDKKHMEKENDGISSDIAHGYTSGTTYPCLGGGFFDCPGFDDSRGAVQDIVNAYSIYKLFEKVRDFRLVLVVRREHLYPRNERGKAFCDVIKTIAEMFPNIDEIKNNINLIIAQGKEQENNENSVKSCILNIKKARLSQKELTNPQERLFEFLGREENKQITFFGMPTVEGDIPTGIQLIKGDTYRKKLSPHIALPAESQIVIEKLANRLTKETSYFLSNFFSKLKGYTEELIKSHEGTAQELRNFFMEVVDKLRSIQNTPKSFEEDVKNIEIVLKKFNTGLDLSFSSLMEKRKFLMRIKPSELEISMDLNPSGKLDTIREFLYLYSKHYSGEYDKNGHLTFSGNIIGTSDIQTSIKEKNNPNLLQISVYALKYLLIDSDIERAGCNIAIASPFCKIVGERCIDLQGKNGDQISPSRALDGENGEDGPGKPGASGNPGNPGQSGGIFYGIVGDIYNEENLTIIVSGGTGGKGQDGGDGGTGSDGIDGNLTDVVKRKVDALDREEKIKTKDMGFFKRLVNSNFATNDHTRKFYKSGEEGEKGGDAGAGGKGGIGGKEGSVIFHDTSLILQDKRAPNIQKLSLKQICEKGEPGSAGNHGEPGKGGKDGKIVKGIYIDKSPNFGQFFTAVAMDTGPAVIAGGGLGAIGGLFGAAIGAGCGVIVGVSGPLIGTTLDYLTKGWEEKPHFIRQRSGSKGKMPQGHNDKGIVKPTKNFINEDEIQGQYRGLVKIGKSSQESPLPIKREKKKEKEEKSYTSQKQTKSISTEVLLELQRKADKEDAEACFRLGRYIYQNEIEKHGLQNIDRYDQARHYLNTAARQGHKKAIIFLKQIRA